MFNESCDALLQACVFLLNAVDLSTCFPCQNSAANLKPREKSTVLITAVVDGRRRNYQQALSAETYIRQVKLLLICKNKLVTFVPIENKKINGTCISLSYNQKPSLAFL